MRSPRRAMSCAEPATAGPRRDLRAIGIPLQIEGKVSAVTATLDVHVRRACFTGNGMPRGEPGASVQHRAASKGARLLRVVAAFAKVADIVGGGTRMSETDSRLANRILAGLAVGAIAGGIVAALGAAAPGLLTASQWLATYVLEPLGQVFLRMLFFV